MLSLLRSLLPASATRVLWVGPDPDGTARELAAAGREVTVGEIPVATVPEARATTPSSSLPVSGLKTATLAPG